MTRIEHVILDYDGTCTDVPAITDRFYALYFAALNAQVFEGKLVEGDWTHALDVVRVASPDAGWTLATTPAAPAAADPYILAGEAAQWLRRQRHVVTPVPDRVFKDADHAALADLRPELEEILAFLGEQGLRVTFISNSSTAKIEGKLAALFGGAIPGHIRIVGSASKFAIGEPVIGDTSLPAPFLAMFRSVPPAVAVGGLARPVYLRRASYAAAISTALGGRVDLLHRTLVCGDIWEMDLALPTQLGASVHLITRAAPFETYAYEVAQVAHAGARGAVSADLTGLRAWFS